MHHKKNCPPPADMVGPRIMHLSKILRRIFNESLAEQGLFSGQQDILFNVIRREGITLGELAKILGVSCATASVSVKRMEKAGFIIKREDKENARIIRLYPTEKAKAAPEKTREKMDSMEMVIKQGMTEEEQRQLAYLLEKAIQNFIDKEDKK